MSWNISVVLAVLALIFVLLTYITSAPLIPIAVILLSLSVILQGK